MRSEFESREAFECIFGDEGEIDLSKDEAGEKTLQIMTRSKANECDPVHSAERC